MLSTTRHRPPGVTAAHVIGFGLLALATISAGACGHTGPEQSDPQIFIWQGELKAPNTLNLREVNGTINVAPSTDDSVRLTAAAIWHRGNPKTDLQFKVERIGGDVTVCVIWGKGSCSSGNSGKRVTFLNWPRGTDATVTLTVSVPERVKLNLVTVNGNITVASTAPVVARTVNGNIKVATAVGPVNAETLNGSVDARMTTLGEDGPVRAITMNGSASAYLPEKFDATVDIASMNGRVGSDFAITTDAGSTVKKNLKGAIGAGGREVKVATMNGSAWLRKLNADGTVAAQP